MEELAKQLANVELAADDIIDTKQQIVHLDAKRHKTREALGSLKEPNCHSNKRPWLCVGDMFIKLNKSDARNVIRDDHYHLDQGVDKLRDQLKDKVAKLRQLEGKPEVSVLNLKPLSKEEINSLRTAFKV